MVKVAGKVKRIVKKRKLASILSTLALAVASFVPTTVNATTTTGGEAGYKAWTIQNHETDPVSIYVQNGTSGTPEIAYCYDAGLEAPAITKDDTPTNGYTDYTRFGYYDGMANLSSARGDQAQIDKIAAVLMAGYPNNGLGSQMADLAQKAYYANYSTLQTYYPNLGLENFMRTCTQFAIWTIQGTQNNGGTSHNVELFTDNAYTKALVEFAEKYPLSEDTATAKNLKVVDSSGKEVNSSNPLELDSTTKETGTFTLEGFNSVVTLPSLPSGYEVVDENGTSVGYLAPNKTYKVKYTGSGEPSATVDLDGNYMVAADSHFYEPTYLDGYVQNLVNMHIGTRTLDLPVVYQATETSSSSSESSSSSSSTESSTTSTASSESSTTSTTSSSEESMTSSSESSASEESTTSSTDETSSTTADSSSSTTAESTTTDTTADVVTSTSSSDSSDSASIVESTVDSTSAVDTASTSDNDSATTDSTADDTTTTTVEHQQGTLIVTTTDDSNDSDDSNGSTGSNGGTSSQTTSESLPQTGTDKAKAYLLSGLGLVVIAGLGIILYRRKKHA